MMNKKILPENGPPLQEVSKYIEKYKNDLIVIKYGGNVFIDRIGEVPQDKRLLFICAAGVRSGLACEMAASMGFDTENLYNIEDGTPYWIAANNPTSYGD